MSPALANFLFESVNFLLLAGVLGWLLFKPIRRALDAEREQHSHKVEESERLRSEAESLNQEARAARESVTREAEERRAELLAAARKEAAQLLEEARKARENERQALKQELETSRDAQATALAETVGRIAAESVRRLLEVLDGPSLDLALVRGACGELEALPPDSLGSVLVESARPLDATTKESLERLLGKGFRERVVTELGAGIRVTTAVGQVDATAASLAKQAARALIALDSKPAKVEGGRDG